MDRPIRRVCVAEANQEPCDTKTNKGIAFYRRPISPDRELLVWEKWVSIRQNETIKLGKRVNRPPTDLAMNLLKKVREDLERKIVLEQAQIEKKSRARGALFERPVRLKQHCYCEPVYEARRTPAELGRPRIIEHVGVPTYVREKDLGMSGKPQRQDCNQLNADYIKYRQKREEELKEKILKIDPFRPSTSNLVIIGSKPKTPPRKIPPLPTIIIDDPTSPPQYSISGIFAVKINKTTLYKDTRREIVDLFGSFETDCTSWTYYFNCPVKRVGRGKLFLQNVGTVTLRYCWRKLKRLIPNLPGDHHEQVFFFNKNEDVLSPGQCRDICFTFVAERAGIYKEFWELNFSNICFFDTINQKLNIDLYADSVEDVESMKRKVEILKTRIHRKTVDNLASEVLNEILDEIFTVAPQSYPYKKYFLEAQLFVMKNPVCFYHQTEVAKMKEIYSKELDPNESWDLSIASWRKVMMSKEYEERMKHYDTLKKSHDDFLKPWYEGDDLIKEKYRAINSLWEQLANELDKDYARLTNQFVPGKGKCNDEDVDPLVEQKIHNIFFLHAYDHVVATIEKCAGVLSSLDSNRWIEFNFCRN